MPTLHMLGTSAGFIHPDRNPSAYLIETEDFDILLDCGDGLARRLAQRRYDWSRLSAIVITHTHADHVGGLPMLIQQLFVYGRVAQRTRSLAIYAPHEFACGLLERFRSHYLFTEAFTFPVSVHDLAAGQPVQLEHITITPYPTSHLERAREHVNDHHYPNRCESFALAIEANGGRILYSGDLGSFEDIRGILPGSTAAIVESSHVDLPEVLSWAKENSGTELYISHIAPEFDESALAQAIASRQLSHVRIAADEMTIRF